MGLSFSTNKYKLEHSFLPIDHQQCCIPVYQYEYFLASSPCKFIYKELNTSEPKWLYYEGYITELTTDSVFSTEVSDTKLEECSKIFNNLLELTEFIKDNAIVTEKPDTKKTDTYTYATINNNYLNQMV